MAEDRQRAAAAAGPPAAVAARSGPGARGAGPRRKKSAARGHAAPGESLLWLAPALLLIAGVVVYPAIQLVRASTGRYSITGLRLGSAGADNYRNVFHHPALTTVMKNTAVWVGAVVLLTILLSLPLAQFLTKSFFGRRLVRWAIIVPWAVSLVITGRLFSLIYNYDYGILSRLLQWLNVIDKPIDFLGDDRWTMPAMIAVGIFVSMPFTAYVFLAGLNGIQGDVYEAARIDGARPWQIYLRITLPLLRPALIVATVLNIIYVFNSFPIIYTLNDRNPGFTHDTSITFMYKVAFKSAERDVGMSAAAGIFNVLLILVVVVFYLRTLRWREREKS